MANEGFQNFNQTNFDANSLANQTSSVIMFIACSDVSPSIRSYAADMNTAMHEVFLQELKNSHRKDDIVIKCITFASDVTHKSGFMPLVTVPDDYLDIHPEGQSTSLYQAVFESLEAAMSYRKDLESQGIDVRCNICIITDGEDNEDSGGRYAQKVKDLVEGLRSNEAWINSFTITMIGVGNASSFRASCVEMGLDPDKCLSTIGTSAHEIRKQMGVVSQSVSASSAAGAGVQF